MPPKVLCQVWNIKIIVSNSPKELAQKFFTDTVSTYDSVAKYATLGQDKKWKSYIIKKIRGDSILDLACGTGILTRMIAQKFPKSQILGIDISQNYLDVAIKNSNFSNVSFLNQDAEKLSLEKKFDSIVSSYIPKYCDAKTLIQKCVIHLNKDGRIILHDFAYPKSKLVQKFWHALFAMLQICGKFIPSWSFAFANLPGLVKSSDWIEQYRAELESAGFEVETKYFAFGCSCVITAILKQ